MYKNKALNIDAFLFALILFLVIPPYFMWGKSFQGILLISLYIILLKNIQLNTKNKIFPIFMSLLYLIMGIRHADEIVYIFPIMFISILFFTKDTFFKEAYINFHLIYSVICFISLIFYFLFICGVPLSYTLEPPINPIKEGTLYRCYIFLTTSEDYNIPSFRFHSIFDEPGVVGTISAVLLVIEKFNIKRIVNIPIFIAGIASFSFFFIGVLLIYIYAVSKFRIKLYISIFIILLVFLLYDDDFFYEMLFRRFEFVDGKLVANNRDQYTYSLWYEKFRFTFGYFFGLGSGKAAELNHGGASYKDRIVEEGLIFVISYILSFVFFFIKKNGLIFKRLFIYLLIFGGVFFQRPFLTDIFYVFLLYIPIFVLKNERCAC